MFPSVLRSGIDNVSSCHDRNGLRPCWNRLNWSEKYFTVPQWDQGETSYSPLLSTFSQGRSCLFVSLVDFLFSQTSFRKPIKDIRDEASDLGNRKPDFRNWTLEYDNVAVGKGARRKMSEFRLVEIVSTSMVCRLVTKSCSLILISSRQKISRLNTFQPVISSIRKLVFSTPSKQNDLVSNISSQEVFTCNILQTSFVQEFV